MDDHLITYITKLNPRKKTTSFEIVDFYRASNRAAIMIGARVVAFELVSHLALSNCSWEHSCRNS
jgi:hypothetical protein